MRSTASAKAASLRLPVRPVERLEEDADAVGYDLIYTMDILAPVREMLNRDLAEDTKSSRP